MIATCGHKVFEGISCSLKLSEKEWSYGTYCADCLKSYFDNNEIDNESEVVKLLQELAKLKEENEKSFKLISQMEKHLTGDIRFYSHSIIEANSFFHKEMTELVKNKKALGE